MPSIQAVEEASRIARDVGRVSGRTLEKWALVRQIAELEEALADSFHRADREMVCAWTEATRRELAQKRAALRDLP